MTSESRLEQSPKFLKMELGRYLLQLSLVLLLVTFSSGTEDGEILQVVKDVKQEPSSNYWVTALFVFGDSVVDAGTNNHFPSLLQANFLPYGTEYFGQPTGRFTNGRTYADFFAKHIGLGIPDPYLVHKGPWDILQGVNYASAGSGLLRTTNADLGVVPFPDQILQFGQTKATIEETVYSENRSKQLFVRSIYLINIGANDLLGYITNQTAPQGEFIDSLLVILKDAVKVLYGAGAQKIVILGSGPLGCAPGALAAAGIINGHCVESWNDITEAYNAKLEELVLNLRETFPKIKAIVGKPYHKLHDLVYHGEKYGFTAGLTACCGSGLYNAAVQCGRPSDIITNPPSSLCEDSDKHVFWDFYHPTEKAYGLVVEELWSGNSTHVEPMNLQALVYLEPEDGF